MQPEQARGAWPPGMAAPDQGTPGVARVDGDQDAATAPGRADEPTRVLGRPVEQTRQEAQHDLVLGAFRGEVASVPAGPAAEEHRHLFREHHILVLDDYLDRVVALDGLTGSTVGHSLVQGVTMLRVPVPAAEALAIVRAAYGTGVAALDHIVSIAGAGGRCPATEPEVVPGWAEPDPRLAGDHAAGEGIRVVVIDTGLDPAAAASHPWMAGVTGDSDPAIADGHLGPYAGHGTFIAGVVRCVAPRAEVIVRGVFDRAGATFESSLVSALDDVLNRDFPDIISMSAGTWTSDATGLLGLRMFHETRLRHHKGVALVVAAGNDSSRHPFWPAAAPWTVSVGALGSNWRDRAGFSNFGSWVDVYAPGENLVNAFPEGTYQYREPPLPRPDGMFHGMARWSGTSFSTPVVAGLIAVRMSRTGENAWDAAAALLATARCAALPGVGPMLLPG